MPRVNVWIPAELHDTVRDRLPELNLSAAVQEHLVALLECRHDAAICRACTAPLDLAELIAGALGRFYTDAVWELAELVRRGGTAEGAARVLKSTAGRHRIAAADRIPLPRPTRAERIAMTTDTRSITA